MGDASCPTKTEVLPGPGRHSAPARGDTAQEAKRPMVSQGEGGEDGPAVWREWRWREGVAAAPRRRLDSTADTGGLLRL